MDLFKIPFQPLFQWIRSHIELLFWIAAMIALFFLPENKPDSSICVFSLLGVGQCPGCGIGHSIHFALHLQLADSFQHHPMGIFAVMVIFIRLKQLLFPLNNKYEA